ncbi:hypothetical protein IJ847_02185, partial [Candidatus Saccharibacteria bacterium]|nr:hypothetical protein [Candidatus Saccharibacteria bacterium]
PEYYTSSTTVAPVNSAVNKDYLDARDFSSEVDEEEMSIARQTKSVLRGVERIAPGSAAPQAPAAPSVAPVSAPTPVQVSAPAPAPAPAPTTSVVREGRSGKRVIKPLNTEDYLARRAEIERQMSELLSEPSTKVSAPEEAAKTAAPEQAKPQTSEAAPTEGNLEMEDYHALDGIQSSALSQPEKTNMGDEATIRELADKEAQEVAAAKEAIEAEKNAAEEPEKIEAIKPGYVTDLAEQIIEDNPGDADPNSMEARMMQELGDDEITRVAEQIREEKAQEPEPEKEGFLDNNEEDALPEFLKEDLAGLGPNIVADNENSAEDADKTVN